MCIAWSMMGRRRKTADPAFQTHTAFYDNFAVDEDLNIIENVTEYGHEIVETALGPAFAVKFVKLDPRVLGMGASRARVFIVAIRRSKLRWKKGFSLTDFIDALTSQVVLHSGDYWWQNLPVAKLSPSDETWLHPFKPNPNPS